MNAIPTLWLAVGLSASLGCSETVQSATEMDGSSTEEVADSGLVPDTLPVLPDAAAPDDASAEDVPPEVVPEIPAIPDQSDEPDFADAPNPPLCPGSDGLSAAPESACGGVGPLPTGIVASGGGWEIPCEGYRLEVRAHGAGIVRFRYTVDGGPEHWETGAVLPGEGGPATYAGSYRTTEGGACEGFALCTAGLVVTIDPDCSVETRDAGGRELLADGPGGGLVTLADGRLRLTRTLGPGPVFGLGGRTGAMDRRGRTFTLWNTDAYDPAFGGFDPGGDPLYQSIPFLLFYSEGGSYGVLSDDSRRQEVDLSQADTWSVTGGVSDQYVIAGPTPADVIDRYTALTGRPARPAAWALGFHQSRWGWQDAATVLGIAERFRAEAIPCESLWFDIQAMEAFRSFTWDPQRFPSPESLLTQLDGLGFRAVAIVDPGLAVAPGWDIYDAAIAGDHVLKTALGASYVGQVWPGPSVFPDFTREATRAFWADLVVRHTDLGVDGIWIDMNEPADFTPGLGGTVPDALPVDGGGQGGTMADAHNVYGLREAEATAAGLAAAHPGKRPFVLTRAGYSGIQRHAMTWTGDAPSRPEVLANTLPMLLGMGLSGTPFVGSDVAGYSGTADPALYARWLALGSVSPFFRGHAEKSAPPNLPWDYGTEAQDIARALIVQRYQLLPYWLALAEVASRTGAPLLRPLFWEFPEEPALAAIEDQATIGPFVMVAPVLDPAATTRSVVFPPGRWVEWASGAVTEGPVTREVAVTLAALPMWLREGAIVPLAGAGRNSDAVLAGGRTLVVVPGPTPTELTLVDDAADESATRFTRVRLERLAGVNPGMRLTAKVLPESSWIPPARGLVVKVCRVDHPPGSVALDGVGLPAWSWIWDEADLALLVTVDVDPGSFILEAHYDPALLAAAPLVAVPLRVSVPPGSTGTVHVAHSGNGWVHTALAWKDGQATGTVLVPRGEWFEYKYTRGGWESVEKWPGCAEATNRYAFGAAYPGKDDTVWEWADHCD